MSNILIIGAGAIGLVTATRLLELDNKHSITIIDAGDDPRRFRKNNAIGASFSGGDARHVTVTETECPASPLKNIYKPVFPGNGGWVAKPINDLSKEEKGWANEFNRLGSGDGKTRDKLGEKISAINKESMFLWRRYIEKFPFLFSENTGLKDGGVLVFFHSKEDRDGDFQWETHVDSGSKLVRQLSKEDIRKNCNNFAEAKLEGIIVDGFSIHVIAFLKNLINYLERKKVKFFWNKKIDSLQELKKSYKNIIICSGAFGNDLLKNEKQIDIARKIKKVVGVWVTIQNPGIYRPFKIKAPPPTGYINATPDNRKGKKVLIMSGGYGFVGDDDYTKGSVELTGLQVHFEEQIKRVFPKEYSIALKEGTLDRRICARPMTPDGMPVCKTIGKTKQNGEIIVATGNCAGGFTQAQFIAEKILRLLSQE